MQNNVLAYRIDLYFHEYKLAIEIDENGHSNRNIDFKIKRQKAIEDELDCNFIRIAYQKTLTNKILNRLLGFEFKSDIIMESKALKFIVKKILLNYK